MKIITRTMATTAALMLAGGSVIAAAQPQPEPAYPFHDVVYGPEWAPQPGGGVLLP